MFMYLHTTTSLEIQVHINVKGDWHVEVDISHTKLILYLRGVSTQISLIP